MHSLRPQFPLTSEVQAGADAFLGPQASERWLGAGFLRPLTCALRRAGPLKGPAPANLGARSRGRAPLRAGGFQSLARLAASRTSATSEALKFAVAAGGARPQEADLKAEACPSPPRLPSPTDPGRPCTRGRGSGPPRGVRNASPSLSGPGARPGQLRARRGAESGSGRETQTRGGLGSPGPTPRPERPTPGPRPRPYRSSGPANADRRLRKMRLGRGACARSALTLGGSAPLAAGRDRGCGRVRPGLGGRRAAPPRLLGNAHASPRPHTYTWLGGRPQRTFLLPTNQNS